MRRLLLTLAFLFAAPLAYGQYSLYQTCELKTALGQAVSGAQVYILTQPANTSTLTPLATIYSNSTGAGGPVTQPLSTNQYGECSAYATPGVYTVVYNSPYTGQLVFPDQVIPSIGGGGSTLTVQTDGTPNASQALLNFIDPASFNGVSIAWSNPSGGNETFGLTGTLNNSGITNPFTTVNDQVCVLGGACAIPLPTGANFIPVITPPISGNFAVVYPTSYTTSPLPLNAPSTAGIDSAYLQKLTCTGTCPANQSVTWSYTLPSYISAGSVTAVYCGANAGVSFYYPNGATTDSSITCGKTGSPQGIFFSSGGAAATVTNIDLLTSTSGTDVNTITEQMSMTSSDPAQAGSNFYANSVFLLIYYPGTAPANSGFQLQYPLFYNADLNILGVDALFPQILNATTVGALFPAPAAPGARSTVTDGSTSTDCTVGGGSNLNNCKSNGTAWVIDSGGANIGGGALGSAVYQTGPGSSGVTAANTTTGTLCLTETGTGSVGAAPIWGACSGSSATAFSAVTGSTNTGQALLIGNGSTFGPTGTGIVTASALASTPSLCSTGNAPTGVLANGNATGCAPVGGGGTVIAVTGTAPVVSSGGTTPAISMAAASASVNGYLTSANWTTFNGKQAALGFTPAHSGANADITSLAGLTTPLSVPQGGTGDTALTGYVYGNGTSAMTASTTIPGSAVSGNIAGDAANLAAAALLPTGTTAATPSINDNSAKLATTAYVASPGAISPTAITMAGSGVSTVRIPGSTFATITGSFPCNSSNSGRWVTVTDSTTVVWGATITGGGTNTVGAFCDGSSYTVAAK